MFGKLSGKLIGKIKDADFGEAASVLATTESVTIVRADSANESVLEYVSRLSATMDDYPDSAEKTKERIASVTGGVGVVKVPASTQSSGFYYQEVVDDAWRATRAAIHGGVLAGGGAALYRASGFLRWTAPENVDNNVNIAIEGICAGLKSVMETVCDNAGFEPAWYGDAYPDKGCTVDVSGAGEGADGDAVELGVLDSAPAVMAAVELALDELALWVNSKYLLVRKSDDQ
jgi:chaperonin GroEL